MASYRDYGDGDQGGASDALANLREMHRNGDITDEEFRTIKARTQLPCSGESKIAPGDDVALATTVTDGQTESTD